MGQVQMEGLSRPLRAGQPETASDEPACGGVDVEAIAGHRQQLTALFDGTISLELVSKYVNILQCVGRDSKVSVRDYLGR